MFWLRNKKIIFNYTLLSGGLKSYWVIVYSLVSKHEQSDIAHSVLQEQSNLGLHCFLQSIFENIYGKHSIKANLLGIIL